MTKKIFFSFWILLILGTAIVVFNSCNSIKKITNPAKYDEGVVINGVTWATRNVDALGRFASTPESSGMLYQWNRKKAWTATGDVTDWDSSIPKGDVWKKANDPSPSGWRVPTLDEIKTLFDTDKVTNEWITQNGVNGRKFTDKTTGLFLFLPAVGSRYFSTGTLSDMGEYGYYWCSMAQDDSSLAYDMSFNSGFAEWFCYPRRSGISIRPVAK